MNTRILLLVVLLVGSCNALLANSDFVSQFLTSGTLTINVPDNRVLRINAFTQNGGSSRATMMASLSGGTAATVLVASKTDAIPPDPVNHMAIQGPATVTVNAVTSATIFITYRITQEPN